MSENRISKTRPDARQLDQFRSFGFVEIELGLHALAGDSGHLRLARHFIARQLGARFPELVLGQSCELPMVAFPVLEPEIFGHKYNVNYNRNDLESLKMTAEQTPAYLNIITIPDDPTQMTANIKAPIVINLDLRIARQCVLQDNHLAIKEPIFTKLHQEPRASI